jgi:hypothetical protein
MASVKDLVDRIITVCDEELANVESQTMETNKYKLQNLEQITKILMSLSKEGVIEKSEALDLSDKSFGELQLMLTGLEQQQLNRERGIKQC